MLQVRALQGLGWQRSEEEFAAFSGAVTKYARWQLEGVRRGDLQPRELSSARMLLRGTIKQVSNPLHCDTCSNISEMTINLFRGEFHMWHVSGLQVKGGSDGQA